MVGTFFLQKDLFGLDTIPYPSESTEISVQSTEMPVRPGPVRMERMFLFKAYLFTCWGCPRLSGLSRPSRPVRAHPGFSEYVFVGRVFQYDIVSFGGGLYGFGCDVSKKESGDFRLRLKIK